MTAYVPGANVAWLYGGDFLDHNDSVYLMRVPDEDPLVLTGIGAQIWFAALAGVPAVTSVASLTGESEDTVAEGTTAFLHDLIARGLLIHAEEKP